MSNKIAVRSIRVVFLVLVALLVFAWGSNAAQADEGQVSIAGNGQTMIRNATVTAISGPTLTIATGWGETKLLWRVETTGSTAFFPQMSSSDALEAIKVGDRVSLSGTLDMSAARPTILASALRDNSLENTAARLSGTVLELDPRNSTFTLATASGTITVSMASRSVIVRDGSPIGLTRLEVGESVEVSGSHNLVTHTLRAAKVASTSVPDEPLPEENEPREQPAVVVPATSGFLSRLMSWIYGAPGQVTIR